MQDKSTNGHANMGADGDVPSIGMRPQGNKGKRLKAHKPGGANGKRALKLSLSNDVYERLFIHALRRNQNLSEVVEDLANKHLNEWILHAKPGPRSEAG
jgi:hypothetical protein